MNTLLEKLIRTRLIEVHKEFEIDYSSYSQQWREWVEKLAWDSVHAISTVKNITINEAIYEVL